MYIYRYRQSYSVFDALNIGVLKIGAQTGILNKTHVSLTHFTKYKATHDTTIFITKTPDACVSLNLSPQGVHSPRSSGFPSAVIDKPRPVRLSLRGRLVTP